MIAAWPAVVAAAIVVTPPGVTCLADPRLQAPVSGQDYCFQSTDQTARTWSGSTWVNMDTGGTGITGTGLPEQVTFWTAPTVVAGDTPLRWTASPPTTGPLGPTTPVKGLAIGTLPQGTLKPGPAFIGLTAPANAVGMQALQVQTYVGAPGLAGLVTVGDDRVGVSSWSFRGGGASNPIYGANFGVVFNTNGVANGLEVDVQNDSATNFQGQALWLNGSTRSTTSQGHRANAILIDTQDGSKWDRGILFKEGFVANGATGSILNMGIHFEHSQDADFIVIQPRVGAASNVAVKVTNPAFTLNRFELLNSGTLRVSNSMTGPAFPSYSFIEGAGPGAGLYLEAVGTAAVPPGPGGIPPAVPATGGVLGFATTSQRRMTLGEVAGPPTAAPALNLWPWGAGANQGGGINLFDPTSVHSVGFLAPDFIGNTFRIRLPNAPGLAGQCVITGGGLPTETWSYGACGTGGPGGSGTVTNSTVLNLNQLVVGGGGVDVKSLGTPGATTQVLHGNPGGLPTWSQVQIADIAATGTPSGTTVLCGNGTWCTPPGGGTVTTTPTPAAGQVAFMTGLTSISSSANLLWTDASARLQVGAGTSGVTANRVAVFNGSSGTPLTGQSSTTPTVYIERWDNSNTIGNPSPYVSALEVQFNVPGQSNNNGEFSAIHGVVSKIGAGSVPWTLLNGVKGDSYASPTADNVGLFGLQGNVTLQAGTLNTAGAWGLELNIQNDAKAPPADVFASGTGIVQPHGAAVVSRGTLNAALGLWIGATGVGRWTRGAHIEGVIPGNAGLVLKGVGNDTPRLEFQNDQPNKGFLTQFSNSLFMGANANDSRMEMQLGPFGPVFFYTQVQVVPPNGIERGLISMASTAAGTTGPLYPMIVHAHSSVQMANTFGPGIRFEASDQDGSTRPQANLIAGRFGSDLTATFALQTYIDGVAGDRLTVNQLGQMFYTPTPSVGAFGLTANGTRTSELQFYTENNANVVALVAPATATGNFVWRLPTTFGGVGTVLTNDGAGNLSWGAVGSGSVSAAGATANQFAFFTGPTSLTSSASFSFNPGSGVVSLSGPGTLQIGLTPTVARPLNVTSAAPPSRFERSDGATVAGSGTAQQLVHTSSGQMANGFDVLQSFILRDADGADNTAASMRAYRDVASGTPDTSFGFAISTLANSATADRLWINGTGEVNVGTQVGGSQAVGALKVGTNIGTDNTNPYQTIMGQMINGTITPGPASIVNDKVAVSGWSYRGTGGTSPIYGGHFGISYTTAGVANGIEVGVQNSSGSTGGNGVWINGSGSTSRDNAILIDTQNSTKWAAGIRFLEGTTGGGATGSVSQFGIIFDKSQDADFIVIRPRVGAANAAIRITDSTFATNRFIVNNDGSMVLGGASPLAGAGAISTVGGITTSGNIGGNQYFSNSAPGFGTTGTGTVITVKNGAGVNCTITFAGGIVIGTTC
jgi:hypothetical protein